jgi:hypothetical protein
MLTPIDFKEVSPAGLESSPVADALAGLRANDARYFKNKYDIDYATSPASEVPALVEYVATVLKERDIVVSSQPLEAAELFIDDMRWVHVYYESGLAINVMYSPSDPKKRAVGFKLSMGMDVPPELVDKFKFARQKSKLAGEIRGSYFVVKGEY